MADERKPAEQEPDYGLAAFKLRLTGASYGEISAAMGRSVREIKALVARAAREQDAAMDSPADVETLALARVDAMLLSFMTGAQAGDTAAAATVLALERRRDVLLARRRDELGLDSWKLDLPLDPEMP